jgi:hypothetical protein
MSILKDHIPDAIPSHKCHISMGLIVIVMWVFEMYHAPAGADMFIGKPVHQ